MSPPQSAILPAVESHDYGLFGPVEVRPLSNIREIVAHRLQASWGSAPHVAHFDEVDLTELEAARAAMREQAAARGIKLTILPFVARACALALMEFPEVNASLCDSGRNIVLKRYCHIGFAANTPDGSIAPVVRNVDRMPILDIARAIRRLTAKARTGRLTSKDMEGGCFSISDLGVLGGTAFTPAINAPEVAALGIARVALKPMRIDRVLVPRPTLPLCLVYDHRAIDGAQAGEFMAAIRRRLANPDCLLS